MSKLIDRTRFKLLFAGVAGLLFTKKVMSEEEVLIRDPYTESRNVLDCDANYKAWGYKTVYACRSAWYAGEQREFDALVEAEAEKNEGMLQEFLNDLSAQFESMLKDTLGTINTIFTIVFIKNQTDTTESFSKFGDSLNKTREVSEETKLQRNSMVGPQFCEGAILGESAMNARESTRQDNVDIAKKSIEIEVRRTPESNPFDDIAHKLNYKYGASSGNVNGHFDLSLITSEVNLDKAKTSQALDVVDALTLTGFDTPYTPPMIDENKLNQKQREARKHLDMHQQHFLFARQVLSKSVTRRAAISQERSVLGVMETDVNRTYAGQRWRSELQGFASPVPLHEVCLTQQALNNHINNERVKIREDKVRLGALIALARMDSNERTAEIFSKYNS